MKYYIFNSAVITTPGSYEYDLITKEQAQEWLATHEYLSTIGYPETAAAFKAIFGVEVACQKLITRMESGDEALVFRLTARLPYTDKGRMGIEWIMQHCEVGLLKKTK